MNQMSHRSIIALVLLLLVLPVSCDRENEERAGSSGTTKPVIVTSFYPLRFFAERLTGGRATVRCPVPPDQDPSGWTPDRSTVRELQRADLIVINGAGYEGWLDSVSVPRNRVVNTTRPFRKKLMTHDSKVTHSHGPEGEHSHANLDSHTWMDPVLARKQVKTLYRALTELDAFAEDSLLKKNYQKLTAELRAIDNTYKQQVGTGSADVVFIAAHPSYNYLARRYNLEVRNIALPPGEKPDAEARKELEEVLNENDTAYLLWPSAPDPPIEKWYQEEYDLRSAVLPTCERDPAMEDAPDRNVLDVIRANAETLTELLARK